MVIIFDNYFACSRFHQSGDQAAFERFRNQDHGFRFCRYRDIGFAGAAFLAEEPFALLQMLSATVQQELSNRSR